MYTHMHPQYECVMHSGCITLGERPCDGFLCLIREVCFLQCFSSKAIVLFMAAGVGFVHENFAFGVGACPLGGIVVSLLAIRCFVAWILRSHILPPLATDCMSVWIWWLSVLLYVCTPLNQANVLIRFD